MKLSENINSIDDIEFDLVRDGRMKESSDISGHYVNNKDLYQEYVRYNEMKKEALENGEPIPPLTEKIGAAIIQIATRRCNSRSFVGYTNNWKEELISNAILTAAIRGHSFDPNYSDNPFAYLTQVCNNAIIEQLNKEKRQLYVRYKSIDEYGGFYGDLEDSNVEGSEIKHFSDDHIGMQQEIDRMKFIEDFERSNFSEDGRKNRKGKKNEDHPEYTAISTFIEE